MREGKDDDSDIAMVQGTGMNEQPENKTEVFMR